LITIQSQPFSPSDLVENSQSGGVGAQVCFIGSVRDYSERSEVVALEIEHYPGMTETALQSICDEAQSRWPVETIDVIHRIGLIKSGEPIVGVSVTSAHRHAAFEVTEFVMDYLKLKAPFWKKELSSSGTGEWVKQKTSDIQSASRWDEK